ncbi:MAG: AsmA family protein [Rhodospirillales bacterium]|nr:AsmA family protein [Rhodospirillales bacterium]
MPRRRRRPVLRALLAGLLLLVALVVAASVAVTLLIDPNDFKPEIASAVGRATGVRLDMRGPIRVGWSLPPHLTADDLVLTAADGAATLRLGRLAARVALLPLLGGEVAIVRLDLLRPQLALTPPTVLPPAAPPAPPPAAPARTGGPRLRLAVEAVHVRDGEVRRGALALAVPRLDGVAAAPGASLVVAGELVSAGRRFMLSGETGPLEALPGPAGAAPWPVQLVLQGEGARLAVRGTLTPHGLGYAVQADAAATDLTGLAPFLPVPVPALHDISVSARLAGAGLAPPEASALAVHVGGLDLGAAVPGLVLARADFAAPDLRQPIQADVQATWHGTPLHLLGTVGPLAVSLPLALAIAAPPALQAHAALTVTLAAHPALRGSLAVQRLDLDALLAALSPPRPAVPAPAAPAPAPRPARLIPDRPFDLAPLRAADADLQITIAALQTGGATYADVSGHLVLQGGRLTLDPLSGQSPGGRLAGRLAIDAAAAPPPMALTLHAPALSLAPFTAGAIDSAAAVEADLTAAGGSPHALAASLGGHFALTARNGDIDTAVLAAMLGGVLHAARLPESALGTVGRTPLRCLDLRLTAVNGSVTVASLFADTPSLAVQGGGRIELATEALNLHLRPLLRVGPGVVVPVRVGGTFADPKPALDAGGAARALLGAGAPPESCGPAGEAAPAPAQGAAPGPAQAPAKLPKPIDILRGLLAH